MGLLFTEILTDVYKKSINKNMKYSLNCKYTIEQYFEGIMDVLKGTHSWRQYNGLIDGRTLNNKHNEFCKMGIYKKAYTKCLDNYLKNNRLKKFKYQSIDTSFVQNKQCVAKLGRNKYYKSKKGIKISSIVDGNGIPLSLLIVNGSTHDSVTVEKTIGNMFVYVNAKKYKDHNRYKQYFLADMGYDSMRNRNYLNELGYTTIIPYNKRNTKDINKMKRLSAKEYSLYKKRIIVENYYSWIKAYPKINNIYEKTIESYNGLLHMASIIVIFNKMK